MSSIRCLDHRLLRHLGVLLLGLVLVLSGCGGGGDAAVPAVPARIVVTPGAALLTAPDQSKTLTAQVLDADGHEIQAAVQWESSRPEQLVVDANGVLRASGAGGTSQITARVGDLRSAPVLAVHTAVASGVQLLSDAQIVGTPQDTDPNATTSVANSYQVVLTGTPAPEVGRLVVGTEGKAVAGRVLGVVTLGAEHRVTVGLVPLPELFPALELSEVFDLNQAEVEIPAQLQALYDIERQGNTYRFTPRPGRIAVAGAPAAVQRQRAQVATPVGTSALPPFGSCAQSLTGVGDNAPLPVGLSVPPVFKITLNNRLDVLYSSARGLERLVVHGEPNVAVEGGLKATVAFEGKVACEAELLVIRIPVGGPLSFFIGGLMPVGVGVELSGKVTLATLGITAKAEAKTTVDLGIVCPGGRDCGLLKEFGKLETAFTPTLDAPGLQDLRLEPSLATYGFVKASIGNPFLKKLRFDALAVKAGVALKGSFAPAGTQIADAAYKSDYKLVSELKAGAGTELQGVAALLGLKDLVASELEITADLATTPVGTVTADKAAFLSGDRLNFTVQLDPSRVGFLPVVGPYNVKRIVLMRKTLDFAPVPVASVEAQTGQTGFTLAFTAPDAGKATEFFAFVVTTLLPTDLLALELGQASGAGPVVLTESLPSGREGSAYEAVLESDQPLGSVTWRLAGGALPPGLALDALTGRLSGTPSEPGVSTFTVQVTAGLLSARKALEIQVKESTDLVFENASGKVRIQDFQRSVDATCDVTLRIERQGQTIREIGQVGSLSACTATVPSGSRPSFFGASNLVLNAGGDFRRVTVNGDVSNGTFLAYQGNFSDGRLRLEYRFYAGTFDTIETLFQLASFDTTVGGSGP